MYGKVNYHTEKKKKQKKWYTFKKNKKKKLFVLLLINIMELFLFYFLYESKNQ